jgi:O-antigen/teichoic acid export membrane protein
VTLFARELGAAGMGVFFLFEAVLGLLTIPADLGIRDAVEKRISEGKNRSKIFSAGMVIKFFLIAIILILIFIFRGRLNTYVGDDVVLYLGVALVLKEVSLLVAHVIKGELRVGEIAEMQVMRQFVWVSVALALIFYGLGYLSLIFGLMAGYAVILIWGIKKTTVPLGKPSVESFKSVIGFAKYNAFVFTVSGFLYKWTDIIIIGYILTNSDVGGYEIAWRVSSIVLLTAPAISAAIFPQMSAWDAENKLDEIQTLFSKTILPVLVIPIPALFGVVIFAEDILIIVFGSEFGFAWLALIVLMLERIVRSIYEILSRTIRAVDRPRLAAQATVISIVANISLNIILVLNFGILGAAIATTTATIINTGLHLIYVRRYIDILFPVKEITWCVISAGIMAALLYLLNGSIKTDSLPVLLILIIAGALVYFLFILSSRSIRTKVRSLVSNMVG